MLTNLSSEHGARRATMLETRSDASSSSSSSSEPRIVVDRESSVTVREIFLPEAWNVQGSACIAEARGDDGADDSDALRGVVLCGPKWCRTGAKTGANRHCVCTVMKHAGPLACAIATRVESLSKSFKDERGLDVEARGAHIFTRECQGDDHNVIEFHKDGNGNNGGQAICLLTIGASSLMSFAEKKSPRQKDIVSVARPHASCTVLSGSFRDSHFHKVQVLRGTSMSLIFKAKFLGVANTNRSAYERQALQDLAAALTEAALACARAMKNQLLELAPGVFTHAANLPLYAVAEANSVRGTVGGSVVGAITGPQHVVAKTAIFAESNAALVQAGRVKGAHASGAKRAANEAYNRSDDVAKEGFLPINHWYDAMEKNGAQSVTIQGRERPVAKFDAKNDWVDNEKLDWSKVNQGKVNKSYFALVESPGGTLRRKLALGAKPLKAWLENNPGSKKMLKSVRPYTRTHAETLARAVDARRVKDDAKKAKRAIDRR